jgi:hypothetical protein
VLSARSLAMSAHATMEYVMPPLSNNCTATEERCFLRSPCQDVIRRTVSHPGRKGIPHNHVDLWYMCDTYT